LSHQRTYSEDRSVTCTLRPQRLVAARAALARGEIDKRSRRQWALARPKPARKDSAAPVLHMQVFRPSACLLGRQRRRLSGVFAHW
jgi:hypothetical protein